MESFIYKIPDPNSTFHILQYIKTLNHLSVHVKSVYGFQFCSIFLSVSQYFINAEAEKSLVRSGVTLVLNAASFNQ